MCAAIKYKMENHSQKSFASEGTAPLDRRLVYVVQVSAIILIILFCLFNLTIPSLANEKLEKLWIGLLGSSVGYLLPNPSLKNRITLI